MELATHPLDRKRTALATSEQAVDLLRHSPYRLLQQVCCEEKGDALILRGRLPSYYLKQMAQCTVAGVAGDHRIVNEIEVVTNRVPAN
jgi:hypothetical protein